MNPDRLPSRSPDGNVYVFVEIPRGSQNKYEYDKDLGVMTLDRVLYSAVHYPTEYGFVPRTKSADGELLDAMILVEQPTFPGCLVEVRCIGVLTITHGDGLPEQKLLAVPVNEPRYADVHDVAEVRQHILKEIEHFFDVFKELQGSDVGTAGWEGAERAQAVLDEAREAWSGEHGE